MTPSLHPRDLLLGLLLVALAVEGVRAVRGPPRLGSPHPAERCARPVEEEGRGVRCAASDGNSQAMSEAKSEDERVRAGDRLRGGRVLGRMAPARLRAFDVPVDVNRASLGELASLDGVGPKLAARIVAARPFASVDELASVRGIGAKRLERLRPRLMVSPVTHGEKVWPTVLLDERGRTDL